MLLKMMLPIGIQEQELNMNKQINKSKMKRLVLVLVVLVTAVSCKKEDCTCNRVVEVQDLDYVDYNVVSTVNDCTKQTVNQVDKTGVKPVVGECYQTQEPLVTQQ